MQSGLHSSQQLRSHHPPCRKPLPRESTSSNRALRSSEVPSRAAEQHLRMERRWIRDKDARKKSTKAADGGEYALDEEEVNKLGLKPINNSASVVTKAV